MSITLNSQLLAEAQAAKHQLLTGKQAVSIGRGDKTVTFQQTNIAELDRYIQQLSGSRKALRVGL